MSRKEQTQLAILKVLNDAPAPLGASRIRSSLLASGLDVQPRTIRFHLLQLDRQGFTETISRRAGRAITLKGREELAGATIIEKVGVIASKVDALAYQVSFRPETLTGAVVLNASFIYPEHLNRALAEMKLIYRHNLTIGSRIAIAYPGQVLASTIVPENYIALGTICSITMNGILLHAGIPVHARFGGLLEIRNRVPIRFVELIEYQGSTLDPLEVFIQANMTSIREVVQSGTGIVCAGFREIPAVALDDVRKIERRIRSIGLGGIVELGQPNQPLLGIPVSDGHAGMVVYGGLNPIAALQEAGIPIRLKSLAGLHEYQNLRTVEEHQRTIRQHFPLWKP